MWGGRRGWGRPQANEVKEVFPGTDMILRHVADPKTRRAIADEVRCLTPGNQDPS